MIYYRVALQTGQSQTGQTPTWKWRSSVLTSLDALFGLLRIYYAVPKDQILVFLSSSAEGMEEMLARQNDGLLSSSLSADQVLKGCRLSPLEVTRLELELRADGDHDTPYQFTPPTPGKQALAWAKLLAKVQSGELEP